MKLLVTVLSISLLVGCTITKRHFGPGYHVEWKKWYSEQENQLNRENLSDYQGDYSGKSEPTLTAVVSPIPIDSIGSEVSQKREVFLADSVVTVSSYAKNSKPELNEVSVKKEQSSVEEEPVRKTEPLTWVALILLVGIGISSGLIAMYSSFLYLGAGIFLTGLALLLTVFAFVSFFRVVRNRARYKNKGLTYFLFFVSIAALFVGAVYLIGVSALSSMSPIMGY